MHIITDSFIQMTSYRKSQTPIKLGVKRKYKTRKSIITAITFLSKETAQRNTED